MTKTAMTAAMAGVKNAGKSVSSLIPVIGGVGEPVDAFAAGEGIETVFSTTGPRQSRPVRRRANATSRSTRTNQPDRSHIMPKSLAAATIAALAFLPLLASPSQAVPGQNGDYPGQPAHEWCLAHGGQDIAQPPGSSITACCTATACVICDTNWENCAIDSAYNQRPGGSAFEAADTMAPANQSTPGTTAPANDQLLQFATPMYQMFTVD